MCHALSPYERPLKAMILKQPTLCDPSRYRHGCDPPDHGGIAFTSHHPVTPGTQLASLRPLPTAQPLTNLVVISSLLRRLMGCGRVPSDMDQGGIPSVVSQRGDTMSGMPRTQNKAAQQDQTSGLHENVPGGDRHHKPSIDQLPLRIETTDQVGNRLSSDDSCARPDNFILPDADTHCLKAGEASATGCSRQQQHPWNEKIPLQSLRPQ